jgi:hypothetical protein
LFQFVFEDSSASYSCFKQAENNSWRKESFSKQVTFENFTVKLLGCSVTSTRIFRFMPEILPSTLSTLYPSFVWVSLGSSWF